MRNTGTDRRRQGCDNRVTRPGNIEDFPRFSRQMKFLAAAFNQCHAFLTAGHQNILDATFCSQVAGRRNGIIVPVNRQPGCDTEFLLVRSDQGRPAITLVIITFRVNDDRTAHRQCQIDEIT